MRLVTNLIEIQVLSYNLEVRENQQSVPFMKNAKKPNNERLGTQKTHRDSFISKPKIIKKKTQDLEAV